MERNSSHNGKERRLAARVLSKYSRIEGFSMERVLRRYMQDFEVSRETAVLHERELKRFLSIAATIDGPLAMWGPVDNLWHVFITYTRDYHAFCEALCGRYLHHDPSDSESDAYDSGRIHTPSMFANTYVMVFGELPDDDAWPLSLVGCYSGRCTVSPRTPGQPREPKKPKAPKKPPANCLTGEGTDPDRDEDDDEDDDRDKDTPETEEWGSVWGFSEAPRLP